jgi:putative N6-adenine-specific DNA methylase
MKDLTITVKTLYGFEDILTEELGELGYTNVEKGNRSVQLKGQWKDVYRINYLSRLSISVLVEIESFYIHNEEDLYKQAKKIDWTSYFDVDKTFSVKGAVFSRIFNHTNFPFLVVKDAIVDTFRDKVGERPNVELKSPQVVIDVYIAEKKVVLSLNTSGVPLFQRGYRQQTGEAPMNEVLAAGLLRLSGWDRKSALVDPMCGSGTIAIEAALWAADIPSMIERNHFAFRNFKTFDADAWDEVRAEGNDRPVKLDFPIIAADEDAGMIRKVQRNSRVAPIGKMIEFVTSEFKDMDPPEGGGTLIMNPPYGERMGDEMIEFYEEIGDTFKQKYAGYECWIISSNLDAIKRVGLKPNAKVKVFNGSLECSFRKFDIFEGSIRSELSESVAEKDPETYKKAQKKKESRIERYKKAQEEKRAAEKAEPAQVEPEIEIESAIESEDQNIEEVVTDRNTQSEMHKDAPEENKKPKEPTEKKEPKATKYNRPTLKYSTPKEEDTSPKSEESLDEETLASKTENSSNEEPLISEKENSESKDDASNEKEGSFKDKIAKMKKYRTRD